MRSVSCTQLYVRGVSGEVQYDFRLRGLLEHGVNTVENQGHANNVTFVTGGCPVAWETIRRNVIQL